MKLLSELQEKVEFLTEGEGNSKKHYISGLFLEFDTPNKNNRKYSSEYHDPTVKKYISEKVNNNNAFGECDHPETRPTISLTHVSHRITEMHKDGSNWYGKAIITNTPNGNILKGLLESGGNLGVSSRGLGSLKQCEGFMEVQPDYKLITAADVVSDPSAHGAFVQGIMENVEYFFDESSGSWLAEKTEEIKKKMKKMSLKEISEKKTIMFEHFLRSLIKNKK
jgi:hypothetical protein